MNLGFDFDKVFINYPPLIPGILIDKLYKAKNNGLLKYKIPSKPEQFFRLLTHHHLLRPPINENILFIKKLAQKKQHKHYLISSRFGFLKRKTEYLIKKHELEKTFDGLFFNFEDEQPHFFKERVIKKLNIHHYVDDDLDLLKYLLTKNSNTKFFWFNNKYNGLLKKNLFGITKLSDMLK